MLFPSTVSPRWETWIVLQKTLASDASALAGRRCSPSAFVTVTTLVPDLLAIANLAPLEGREQSRSGIERAERVLCFPT